MKLKDTFVTQEMDGEQVMVEANGGFAGMVRSNATAAFIIDQLKTETTREAILDAMCKKYDAPRAVMAEDVDMVLGNLKKIGALDALAHAGRMPCGKWFSDLPHPGCEYAAHAPAGQRPVYRSPKRLGTLQKI